MKTIEDWKAFADSFGLDITSGKGSNWSLLFARQGRALALPATRSPDLAGLDFFVSKTSKRWWAQLGLVCNRFVRGLLPETELSLGQHAELQHILSRIDVPPSREGSEILAIQFGTRGPLQKVKVLGNAHDGRLVMAKFALRASADEKIVDEARWLRRLAGCANLAPHVPIVSGTGNTSTGRPFFTMNAVTGTRSRYIFGADHANLLRGIARMDCKVTRWEDSTLIQSIGTRLKLLATSEGESVQILNAGWSAACRALADKRMPFCLNHGDFAPWNLLETDRGLVALDWEYAQPHWNPIGDFFHFHLIPAALDGRLRKGRINRERLLSNGSHHMDEVFALGRAFAASIASPLLLVYLVDTVSFYAIASGGTERHDPVVQSYLQYIAGQS